MENIIEACIRVEKTGAASLIGLHFQTMCSENCVIEWDSVKVIRRQTYKWHIFTAWCYVSAAMQYMLLSCVCHKPVLYQNNWTNHWFLAWRLPSSYPRLRFKEIWVSPNIRVLPSGTSSQTLDLDKKLSYRRMTARCVLSVVILPVATQQCRNYLYLYDKSRPNWWYEVGGLVGGNVHSIMTRLSWLPLSQVS